MNKQISSNMVQAALIVMVTAAVVFMSIKNNDMQLLGNLALLCFGYYFGKDVQPPATPAI